MRITATHDETVSIRSEIRNAFISFSEMTVSAVAVVSDVIRDGNSSNEEIRADAVFGHSQSVQICARQVSAPQGLDVSQSPPMPPGPWTRP